MKDTMLTYTNTTDFYAAHPELDGSNLTGDAPAGFEISGHEDRRFVVTVCCGAEAFVRPGPSEAIAGPLVAWERATGPGPRARRAHHRWRGRQVVQESRRRPLERVT